jgi:hypothetical protein
VWNNEWVTAKTGSTAHSFFPDVYAAHSPLKLRSNVLANQLITGHCRLNHQLYRLGYAPAPGCDCGWPDENIFHFLFNCPRFSSHRGKLISAFANSKVTWHPLPHYRLSPSLASSGTPSSATCPRLSGCAVTQTPGLEQSRSLPSSPVQGTEGFLPPCGANSVEFCAFPQITGWCWHPT